MAATKPLWRRIVTIPRLIYFALGVAATLGAQSLVGGPSKAEFQQAGYFWYMAQRSANTQGGAAITDCTLSKPDAADDPSVVQMATCIWEQDAKTTTYEIGLGRDLGQSFVDVKEQEKVN